MNRADAAYDELDVLVERFVGLEGKLARVQAERTDVLAQASECALEYADDLVSPAESRACRRELAHRAAVAELAVVARMSERTLITQLDSAARLCSRPDVVDALRSGEISASHATVILEELEGLACPDGEPLDAVAAAEFERRLLEIARQKSPGEVRRAARRAREQVAEGTAAARHEKARAARHVRMEPDRDGMAWLHALLPVDVAAVAWHDLTAGALALRAEENGDATLDQLRADLLADHLAELMPTVCGAVTAGRLRRGEADPFGDLGDAVDGKARHDAVDGTARRDVDGVMSGASSGHEPRVLPSMKVVVTVPAYTLAGISDAPGELDGYGPIPGELARRLVSHAPSLTRVLTHPVTGAVLDVDRTVCKVPAALRTWLAIRDGTCRFPGCGRRAVACDADHTVAWEHGGTTSADNLAHLCRKHHRLKHAVPWRVENRSGSDGTLVWSSPTGRRYATDPAWDSVAAARAGAVPFDALAASVTET